MVLKTLHNKECSPPPLSKLFRGSLPLLFFFPYWPFFSSLNILPMYLSSPRSSIWPKGIFSLSLTFYFLLIAWLNVLPSMLNLLVFQLCPQLLLSHTILFFSVAVWRLITITLFAKLFTVLLLYEAASSPGRQLAEGRTGSATLTCMSCRVNAWCSTNTAGGSWGVWGLHGDELEFDMHASEWRP